MKQEIDFFVTRDARPWLAVEVKLAETAPSPSFKKFLPLLRCRRGLLIIRQPHWELHSVGDAEVLVAGAGEALMYFP